MPRAAVLIGLPAIAVLGLAATVLLTTDVPVETCPPPTAGGDRVIVVGARLPAHAEWNELHGPAANPFVPYVQRVAELAVPVGTSVTVAAGTRVDTVVVAAVPPPLSLPAAAPSRSGPRLLGVLSGGRGTLAWVDAGTVTEGARIATAAGTWTFTGSDGALARFRDERGREQVLSADSAVETARR